MTTNIITAVVTAYLWTGHPCSDGHYPVVGKTIAVPRAVPLGSTVIIEGRKYLAEDHTAKKYDGRFDIYMGNDRTKALNWGKQTLTVTIYEP